MKVGIVNLRGLQAFGSLGLGEGTGLDMWVPRDLRVYWLIERLNVKRAMDKFLRISPLWGQKRERGIHKVSKGKFMGL